ncbi:gamma-glutamyltransferase family protein [Pseudonocardia ailaonensis]
MVSSTHWLASAGGMRMLELGGNAFDAAVAAGFVLQVVQPHLNGPGGDMPAVVWDDRVGAPEVLCAQGVAPAAASIGAFEDLGLDAVPGTGLLAACVPGAVDGWLLMLRDRGTLGLREVLEPAIGYAAAGHPTSPEMVGAVAAVEHVLRDAWPSTAAVYLPGGALPAAHSLFRNPDLARTYERLVHESEVSQGDREDRIDAARNAFSRGFVAEHIGRYLASAEVEDSSGRRHRSLLAVDDLATWSASWERPATRGFRGFTVCKPGAWSQGPVLLQQLALLDGLDLDRLERGGPDYVHTLVEAGKLAYADREAWYGDEPDVPLTALLSDGYAAERRALIGPDSSPALRPGSPDARTPLPIDVRLQATAEAAGAGEPTVLDARADVHRGDTCHVDVADRFGNMVSATPSGGWLQSSPVIPGLGFPLGTRLQMADLDRRRPNALRPGKRPRTTLSPGLVLRGGEPYLAFGTPGGDQQDQWALQFLLNVVLFGDDLQAAIDRPVFHSAHFPSSFHPRTAIPGRVVVEDRYPADTIAGLRRRGHDVRLAGPWSLTRTCAAGRDVDGVLRAGATPRGMEGYAIGR